MPKELSIHARKGAGLQQSALAPLGSSALLGKAHPKQLSAMAMELLLMEGNPSLKAELALEGSPHTDGGMGFTKGKFYPQVFNYTAAIA